nr:hypothetical protein [Thermus parvatiensis]
MGPGGGRPGVDPPGALARLRRRGGLSRGAGSTPSGLRRWRRPCGACLKPGRGRWPWREERTPREALEALSERLYSFTQGLPEPVHARVMERLWAWAEAELGDLDRPFPVEKRFLLRVSRLG